MMPDFPDKVTCYFPPCKLGLMHMALELLATDLPHQEYINLSQLRDIVEGMDKLPRLHYRYQFDQGYNQALTDILDKLTNKEMGDE